MHDLVPAIIYFVILALNITIARLKGRSVIFWGLASIFLSLIATAILFCVSDLREKEEMEEKVADIERRLSRKKRYQEGSAGDASLCTTCARYIHANRICSALQIDITLPIVSCEEYKKTNN